MLMIEYENERTVRTIVYGIQRDGMTARETEELTRELTTLAKTVDLEVVDSSTIKLKETNARFLVGTGKAEEISQRVKELEADCLIFDDDLSPSQQRNWEKLTGIAVIDRHEVILDIFASRASSREAVLQVELARLEYTLPRLQRAWTHLSRQRGGVKGTRGSGESQLETDRRVIQNRITHIKRELEDVARQRTVRRKQREKELIPSVSIVGYTNAGKSSLLNLLCGADVYVADRLFATLDPTTRKVSLPGGKEIVATDTVGFIRKLPHDLIESFKSTLEETVTADYLIHVLDASNPDIDEHYKTTLRVLDEIGAKDKQIVTVLNKTDLVTDPAVLDAVRGAYPEAFPVSVKTGAGIPVLVGEIDRLVNEDLSVNDYRLPADRYDLVALVHRTGKVLHEEFRDGEILLSAQVSSSVRHMLSPFDVLKS